MRSESGSARGRPSVVVIGAGTVGSVLACALCEEGYPIAAVASRSIVSARRLAERVGSRAESELWDATLSGQVVFITTPDDAIRAVCEAIARRDGFTSEQTVLHASGSLCSSVLEGARKAGARVASLHPLQSFASVEQGLVNLRRAVLAVEGDGEAIALCEQMGSDLGCRVVRVNSEAKALYHAGACSASNYLVAVVWLAVEWLSAAGFERQEALDALMPLIEGSVSNLRELGLPEALTGPVSRGDSDTVRSHIESIHRLTPDYLPPYRELARLTLSVASEKGSAVEKGLERISELLERRDETCPKGK